MCVYVCWAGSLGCFCIGVHQFPVDNCNSAVTRVFTKSTNSPR